MNKPRIIKDYDALSIAIQEQIKLEYPYGFHKKLITFKNAKGAFVSALPFETDDYYYLVRMTKEEARDIIEDDEDFDDDGKLKDDILDEYAEKYGDKELDEDDLEDEDFDD